MSRLTQADLFDTPANTHTRALKSIWVVGDDVHGLSTAVAFATALKPFGIKVGVVSLTTATAKQASLHTCNGHLFEFHRRYQIPERAFMQSQGVAFFTAMSLATASRPNEPVWLANDTWLPLFNGIELHQIKRWLGESASVETSFATAAAKAGKTVFPSGQQGTLGNSFELGAVVDTEAYCAFLTQHAAERGVTFVTSNDIAFERCPRSGDITSLLLSNNQRIQCDWVVDATGSQARVIGQALKQPFESWHAHLPVCHVDETTEQSASHTTSLAVCVTDSGYYQTQHIGGVKRTVTFAVSHSVAGESESGFREPVSHNCLAVGPAAYHIDMPGMSTLHITHRIIERFLNVVPCLPAPATWGRAFNRSTKQDCKHVRDFSCLLLSAMANRQQETGKPWQVLPQLPEPLTQALALFNESARCSVPPDAMIHRQRWLEALALASSNEQAFEPLLNAVSQASGKQFLQRIATQIQSLVSQC
ncbi:tryptophan 7-halogenase [Aestuariibacter sp. GS-14]|uniref:FAD-dependent oxidoreductase n=1 Tax=Aestuariibacter sp. GS-14 TaxID=2590670 RepID=UPI0011262F36|nr:FAD-dependent oxidoreductase [Aestuariibacter sp. GS-14]TPV61774.1 tryptophan 7-halogenase [Aestuariibacter sp. GS-14]